MCIIVERVIHKQKWEVNIADDIGGAPNTGYPTQKIKNQIWAEEKSDFWTENQILIVLGYRVLPILLDQPVA